jgi:hypothetical protein
MMLEAALGYAARGWPVLPLVVRGKTPLSSLVRHGVAHATCDVDVITYWYSRFPEANVGIACASLLVIDVDPRNGGDRTLSALLEAHGPFPTTPTQRTGGGGLHYLFERPAVPLFSKLKNGVDVIHGSRRYIVAGPSRLMTGGRYEWLTPPGLPLVAAPDWLLRRLHRPPAPSPPVLPAKFLQSERVARAAAYAKRIPPAISGQGGHAHTFLTACRLVRGFSLSSHEAFLVMSAWNRSCKPPWSEKDLRRKIEQALAHGRMPLGALLEELPR